MRSDRIKEGPLGLQRGGEEKSGEREGEEERKRNEGGRVSRPRVTDGVKHHIQESTTTGLK